MMKIVLRSFFILCILEPVWALDYGTPTYDVTDTMIDFQVHFKNEPKSNQYPFTAIWNGSGTRIGPYIITNAHVVCSPHTTTKEQNIWLSFPNRWSYLKHFNFDIEMPVQLAKEYQQLQAGEEIKTTYIQQTDQHTIAYKAHIPEGFTCNPRDTKSRHDVAILEPIDASLTSFFSVRSGVKKISCSLPIEGNLSMILAGGVRNLYIQNKPFLSTDYQTSLGAMRVVDQSYNDDVYPFGMFHSAYKAAQVTHNQKLQHSFYIGKLNFGDSGAGFFQTECVEKNGHDCLKSFMSQKIYSAHHKGFNDVSLDSELKDFLISNEYYYYLDSYTAFSTLPFWGIAEGKMDGKEFAVTFYENKSFLQTHLPEKILDESCFE